MYEGPETEDFDAIPAMTLWNDTVKTRRNRIPRGREDTIRESSQPP